LLERLAHILINLPGVNKLAPVGVHFFYIRAEKKT